MACCTLRTIILTTCILQLISVVQRQVIDFLGFMWTPIIANFLQIIISILGIFGAYQHKTKYIICYGIWTLLWLAWNLFVICLYLEAGGLSRDSDILNMGTGSRSWWMVNGAGCLPIYNNSSEDPLLFPTPAAVEGCVVEYFYIESIQAAIQCFLAVIGIISSSCAIYKYNRDDDTCPMKPIRNLPYSIEYHHNNTSVPDLNSTGGQRPMTPRKVKQRSTRSKRGSRRPYYQNPVTKLINASNQNSCISVLYPGQSNPVYNSSGPPSQEGSRATSMMYLNGRPSPIYMNETDTVI